MITLESTKERLKDHEIDIQVEDGYNRIIRFHKDNKVDDSIYITTWKNRLCYSGDLGTFVFSHSGVEDMLRFFRGDINPDYWRESLKAGVALQFDRDSAEILVRGWIKEWYEDLEDEQKVDFDEDSLIDFIGDATSGLYDIDCEHKFFDYLHSYSDYIYPLGIDFNFSDMIDDYDFSYYGYNIHTQQYEFACYALHILAWRIHDCT